MTRRRRARTLSHGLSPTRPSQAARRRSPLTSRARPAATSPVSVADRLRRRRVADARRLPSTGGTTTVAHIYDDDGTFTVRVTRHRHGGQRSQTQRSGDRGRAGASIASASRHRATTPATGADRDVHGDGDRWAGVTIRRYEWTFGDGSTQSTTTNDDFDTAYSSTGQKTREGAGDRVGRIRKARRSTRS